MKLSPQEKADRKASFRRMSVPGKLEYIFSYYKLPIVLILIGVIFAVTVVYHTVTRKNELIYLGLINVAVGDDMNQILTDGFVEAVGEKLSESEVYVYSGLYLSENPAEENHEYSYASRLKLLASVNAMQMDVVLLNRESYDILSHSGYLIDLGGLLGQEDPQLLPEASALLTENEVILEDNAIEMELGTADAYQAETVSAANALEISGVPILRSAGFQEPVYLCVIANSPRLSEAAAYIRYVLTTSGAPIGQAVDSGEE